MGSIIKSVSLDFAEVEFLNDFDLSPTKLLKEKIWEMKGMMKKMVSDRIEKMAYRIQIQAERIVELENVLEKERTNEIKVG